VVLLAPVRERVDPGADGLSISDEPMQSRAVDGVERAEAAF